MMRIRLKGLLTLLVLAGLVAYISITLSNMRTKVTEASKTVSGLQEQIEQLQETNAALQYAIDNQDDPDVLEDIARTELGLVMPDELIFYDSGT